MVIALVSTGAVVALRFARLVVVAMIVIVIVGTLCNHKANAGKVSERDEERVGPVRSLTVAERVAFASRRIATAARRWLKCNLSASDDVPSRWWGRSCVYGDEKPAEREYTAWH